MLRAPSTIQAVLLDLDGVLYIGDKRIRGAVDAVHRLKREGYRLAGVTNTTTRSRAAIAEKLQKFEFPLAVDDIYTPAALAIAAIGTASARLCVRDALLEDFAQVRVTDPSPEYIVMGDVGGDGYDPTTLTEIFNHVMRGAKVLALHKNRFWQKPDGLHLDIGPFVAAIEYATGQSATTLGKPSADFFLGICKSLGSSPEESLMIGDDVESDIGGAQGAGLKSALVKTGKYREAFVKQMMKDHGIKPTVILPSIADLPDALSLL